MSEHPSHGSDASLSVWERAEPSARPTPSLLSRDMIVRAAMTVADRENLEAVSVRRIAAELNSGPMRLYRYLSSKEELLDLMIDAAYGEMVAAGTIDGDWRAVLETVAERLRAACRDHRWLADLIGGRPHLGPNALTFLEHAYAALRKEPRFGDINLAMEAMGILNAYLVGAIRGERGRMAGDLSDADWRDRWWPYLERQIRTGRFPELAAIVAHAADITPAAQFRNGLDAVLDGIEARIGRAV